MPITHRLFAVAFQQNMRALENIDIETQDALVKLCDPESQITRADAEALALALILELREKKLRDASGEALAGCSDASVTQ
jgi:hypothetical protein